MANWLVFDKSQYTLQESASYKSMIEVKELTKIYKSRKSGSCTALDHISFSLPDKGFVFVIGKSGSGKTTLLSLLGGLDTITSGEIIANGKHVETFRLKEQIAYRNSTVGFIFQDFHLIDELTISENIALALEIRGDDDAEKVKKALEDTDLADFGNRYPKELSGGQKQRVAIARALIKQPPIILADEPTGNLDSKTTAQILDLLKELSKEKLVVIVSHNLADAQNYADEILELSDGKIIQHLSRNGDFDAHLRLENDTLVIPSGEEFSDENIQMVNDAIKNGYVKGVRQEKNRFLPHEESSGVSATDDSALGKKHLRFKSAAKLSVKFARRGWIRTCVYSLIFAAVLVVLGLSQLIMDFNGGEVIAAEMSKRNLSCNSFIKDDNSTYEVLDATYRVDVEANDLQKFYDAGYNGKAYPFINYPIYNSAKYVNYEQKRISYGSNLYGVSETAGLLITDEEFFKSKFGKLEFVAKADEQRDDGVFITDYLADSVIANYPSKKYKYEDFLKEIQWNSVHSYGYVNGIINTGYKDRYKNLIETLTDPTTSKDELRRISESDEGLAFFDELTQYLNIAYTFNENFVSDATKLKDRQFVLGAGSAFEKDGHVYEFPNNYFSDEIMYDGKRTLGSDEIMLNYIEYNGMFGTTYTPQNLQDFQPHTVNLCYYMRCDEARSVKKYEKTVTIVRLVNVNVGHCFVPAEIFEDLLRVDLFTLGYYFQNDEQADLLVNTASKIGFIPNSSIAGSITVMTKAVGVFSQFFNLIFVVLCAALLLIMVQFELKNIKDKTKDIGILKALGVRDIDLIGIFGFQVLVAGLAMVALYIVGSFVFIGLANKVLVLSLNELAKTAMVMDISFLTVKWKYILQNCALACVIMIASFLVPMLRLRYIKPTNVIKAKE